MNSIKEEPSPAEGPHGLAKVSSAAMMGLPTRKDSMTSQQTREELEFKPSTRLYVAFLTLAVITLMVALDGTSLSVALPVGVSRRG